MPNWLHQSPRRSWNRSATWPWGWWGGCNAFCSDGRCCPAAWSGSFSCWRWRQTGRKLSWEPGTACWDESCPWLPDSWEPENCPGECRGQTVVAPPPALAECAEVDSASLSTPAGSSATPGWARSDSPAVTFSLENIWDGKNIWEKYFGLSIGTSESRWTGGGFR